VARGDGAAEIFDVANLSGLLRLVLMTRRLFWFFDFPRKLKTWQAIVLVAVLSICVKLLFAQIMGGGLNSFPNEGTDSSFYDQVAINWLNTGIYGRSLDPSVEMPPGQPALMAILYALFGHSYAAVKFAQVALLTGVVIVGFLTASALLGRTFGFWTGMLTAVDPAQAYLGATFLSEPLFIFLMMLGIYGLVRNREKNKLLSWIVAGLCFGLASLTRNQGWLFALFLLPAATLTWGRILPLRGALVVLSVTALVILPWTVRNYQVAHRVILVANNGGLNLWAANNPEFDWRPPMPMSLPVYHVPAGLNQYEADAYNQQRALAWIAANPLRFAVNGVKKVIALYHFDPLSTRTDVSLLFRLGGIFPYGLLLPFILWGLISGVKKQALGILYLYILYVTLLSIIFWGDSRARAPLQPYLYLFGVLGLSEWRNWLSRMKLSLKRGQANLETTAAHLSE
jgi:4-amino-4-deoxy-L-arabinose transferase-like glycosyltransferase